MTAHPREDAFGEGSPWIAVRRVAARPEAEQLALVLVAVGIPAHLAPGFDGFALLVALEDAGRARRELAAYDAENRKPAAVHGHPARGLGQGVTGTLVAIAALVFVDSASGRDAFGFDWLAAGNAQAGLMRAGEWTRAVTALTLHADFGHIASNLLMGGLFGLLLSQLLGTGVAWLAILVAGAAGNVANALIQPDSHSAIGASTAVFAALGILAVLALARPRALWRRGLRRWAPLAGAFMLFAYFGIGDDRTDIGGHVAGLVAGLLLGAGFYLFRASLPAGRMVQAIAGVLAAAILAGSWWIQLAGASG